MTRTVAVVCGSGVSSTFLARGLRSLLSARGQFWHVLPLALDELDDRADELDVVLLGQHVSAEHAAVSARVPGAVVVPLSVGGIDEPAAREALELLQSIPSTDSSGDVVAAAPAPSAHAPAPHEGDPLG